MSIAHRGTIPGLDVIIIASGPVTSDGRDLCQLYVDGQRVVDLCLQEVSMTQGLQQVAVVTADTMDLWPSIKQVIEPIVADDPLAGVAAGVRTLWHEAADNTAIVAAWAFDMPQLLGDVWQAIGDNDVAALTADGSHPVALWGSVWKTHSLWKKFEFFQPAVPQSPESLFEGSSVELIDANGLDTIATSIEDLEAFGEVTDA